MTLRLSKFGERFTRHTGALELMDDLGRAMSGDEQALMLGGGNPGRIPAVEREFRRRLAEIVEDPDEYARAVANYSHPQGEGRFRRALAELLVTELGWDVTDRNIVLTAGSQAGFFLLFNLLAGETAAGAPRRILLPMTPEYVGYADLGITGNFFRSERPKINELPGGLFKYHVNFDELSIDESVGAVCISRPTNPTGNVITDQELEQLDRLCRARDVPLIVDNAYGMPFPNIVFTDAKPLWNDNVVYCMSLSKLGLPAVRTGIIIAREEIVDALTRMTAILNLAVPSVGPQIVEPMIADGSIIRIARDTIRPYYRDKALQGCEWLAAALSGVPHKIHKPEGAFFLWLWLPGLPIPTAELYQRLKKSGVLILSGHYFFPGQAEDWRHRHECLRISVAQDDRDVKAGIELIGREIRSVFDGA